MIATWLCSQLVDRAPSATDAAAIASEGSRWRSMRSARPPSCRWARQRPNEVGACVTLKSVRRSWDTPTPYWERAHPPRGTLQGSRHALGDGHAGGRRLPLKRMITGSALELDTVDFSKGAGPNAGYDLATTACRRDLTGQRCPLGTPRARRASGVDRFAAEARPVRSVPRRSLRGKATRLLDWRLACVRAIEAPIPFGDRVEVGPIGGLAFEQIGDLHAPWCLGGAPLPRPPSDPRPSDRP
jgi:hypothetical protein